MTTFQLHYLASKLSCLFFFPPSSNHGEDTGSFSSIIRLSTQCICTRAYNFGSAIFKQQNELFQMGVGVGDSSSRGGTLHLSEPNSREILEVVCEHVTQIPEFFFLFPTRFTEFTKRDYPYTFHPFYPPP